MKFFGSWKRKRDRDIFTPHLEKGVIISALGLILVLAGLAFFLLGDESPGIPTGMTVDDEVLEKKDPPKEKEEEAIPEMIEKEVISIEEEEDNFEYTNKCMLFLNDAKRDIMRERLFLEEAKTKYEEVLKDFERATKNMNKALSKVESEREEYRERRDSCQDVGSPY
jgi:hypothetical protein